MSLAERSNIKWDNSSVGAAPHPVEKPVAETKRGIDAIEAYLSYSLNERNFSGNTLLAYRNDLGQLHKHQKAILQEEGFVETPFLDWNKVKSSHIVAFMESLKEKGCAQATMSRKVSAVRSFFHWLVAENIVGSDPTDFLDFSRETEALPRILNHEEVEALLAAPKVKPNIEARRDSAMLSLLYATGMRVSELVSLNIDDIDVASDYVRVRRKGGRERHIPFNENTHEAIEYYLKVSRPVLTKNTPVESGLFVNHYGERLTRQGLWLKFKGYAKDAGIQGNITPYTLRYSFAIQLLKGNVNL